MNLHFLALFVLFASIESFSCAKTARPLRPSSGKRHVDAVDSVGDDELFSDHEEVLMDSLEIFFLYDQMFPDSHYEKISKQLISYFGDLNMKGYFSDIIYAYAKPADRPNEKIKSTDKVENSLLHINERCKPFPKLSRKLNPKVLRPLQVLPQMTLSNLIETFARKDVANFLTLLSSVGPYYSPSILQYFQDPSTPDIADLFAGTECEEPATLLPLHYIKTGELELFHAFLPKFKYKLNDFHARKLYELIQFCLYELENAQTAFRAFETIFKTQQHVIAGFENTLFKLLLKEEAFLTLRLYFKLVPGTRKSSNLFSIVVNPTETENIVDQDVFDLYLLTIPELEVNSLVKIRSSGSNNCIMGPVLLGVLYTRHRFLFHSLLLHPQINLNQDFEFIHTKPATISDFKWPNLPLHIHALLLCEFQKSWEIAFHPLYRHRKVELKYLFNILFIIYYIILMRLKLK